MQLQDLGQLYIIIHYGIIIILHYFKGVTRYTTNYFSSLIREEHVSFSQVV